MPALAIDYQIGITQVWKDCADEANIQKLGAEETAKAFKDTRRLITNFDVGRDVKRAHSSVLPGKRAFKVDGAYRLEYV